MTGGPVIEVSNLCKSFGKIKAVDHLSLTVFSRDIYGLLGPNGSGKSTTIRMLLSLITPDDGQIRIFGIPLTTGRTTILKKTGALVEKPDFYEYLSAWKNLEILLRYSGKIPDKQAIGQALDTAGLLPRAHSKVRTFSKGMKQRLGIAQALIHNPDLIILDEPSSGLDPVGAKEVRDLIVRMNRDLNKTIILSSHNLREVEMIANRMIIINKGGKVAEDTVDHVMKQYPSSTIIETDNPDKTLRILKESQLDIQDLKMQGNRIMMACKAQTAAEANEILVRNGIAVFSLAQERSLEQYFLNIT
ncbi:MAG: ABC transporter ATP-binding protein [Bacteroidales bacterium]|nr:ABC transporter ATP-binding protein [Bacteroidales bacterium]